MVQELSFLPPGQKLYYFIWLSYTLDTPEDTKDHTVAQSHVLRKWQSQASNPAKVHGHQSVLLTLASRTVVCKVF